MNVGWSQPTSSPSAAKSEPPKRAKGPAQAGPTNRRHASGSGRGPSSHQQEARIVTHRGIKTDTDRPGKMIRGHLSAQGQKLPVGSATVRPSTPDRRPPSRLAGCVFDGAGGRLRAISIRRRPRVGLLQRANARQLSSTHRRIPPARSHDGLRGDRPRELRPPFPGTGLPTR